MFAKECILSHHNKCNKCLDDSVGEEDMTLSPKLRVDVSALVP